MFRRRSNPSAEPRRGIILLVVLFLLTLFAVVGLSLVLYADSESRAARLYRDAQAQDRPDVEPELLCSFFLGQLLYDLPDDQTGVFSALRGHSLARTMYGFNCTLAPDGSLIPAANDVPFHGVGRLHYPSPFAGIDDHHLINYTWFPGDGFLRDPERYGPRPGLKPLGLPDNRTAYLGGCNAPYTYPDLNSMFLAALKAGGTRLPDGTWLPEGTLLMPSYHRPWLFGRLTDVPNFPAGNPGNPNWTNREGKYLLLRPRPIDMGPGFPYPEDEGGDVKNLIGYPGYYDPITKRFHKNDSVWIDLDFPVLTARDGRKYKPLFAPLILDLDNRINLNVAGNLRGLSAATHASHMGWGPWEVNPGHVLDRSPPEWPALLRGNGFGGRHGRDPWPHSPLPGNVAAFGPPGRFYAPSDLDASQEAANGAPTESLRQPGTPPSLPFQCFPSVAPGFGSGSVAERAYHPMNFNPFRPTAPDRALGLSNMEALLRYRDTGAQALAGDLFRHCPKNLNDPADPNGSLRRRHLVTVHSVDPDRPGVSPWFWPSSPGVYSRVPGGAYVAEPPFGTASQPPPSLPLGPDSEFGPDGRTIPALTSLRRLNLNRYLPDYPRPGPNGRIANLTDFTAAQLARQYFAAEVFERLWKAGGIGLVPPPGLPGHETDRWEALRWLAQLAVNIVDFIDADDYLTPFNWHPPFPGRPAGEFVFGTELPRIVINEAYAEYGNDPADPGLAGAPPEARRLKANVWVELYNPFKDDPPLTAPHRGGDAVLEVPESAAGAGDAYGVYQLLLARLTADLRQPDNVTGDVRYGTILSRLARWSPEPGAPPAAGVDPRVIRPANPASAGGWFGTPGENHGFYVVGPTLDPVIEKDPFPPVGGGSLATLRRSEMSYRIPAIDPVARSLPQPGVILQRLACPHLPPNPLPGLPVNPAQPYNPYITVDYVHRVFPHYAATVGVYGPDDPPPTPPHQRSSVGRKQPYAAHESQQAPQQPTPGLAGQPQHSFFQHNVDLTMPGPNAGVPPPSYPAFGWLVHLDRPLVSPMELVHVSGYKPHELTQQFIRPGSKLQPFGHRVPWFDEDLTKVPLQSHRLHRVFEFLCTHNPALGTTTAGTRATTAVAAPGPNQPMTPRVMGGATATGGSWQIEVGSTLIIDRGLPSEEVVRVKAVDPPAPAPPTRFLADFLKPHAADCTILPTVVSERLPGKVNLNTVWDEEVFQALCDAGPSNLFNPALVKDVFDKLRAARTVKGPTPGPTDRPFRGLAAGAAPSPSDPAIFEGGIQDTLLRRGSDGYPLLASPVFAHPYEKYELLTKVFNHLTTRSNVFAVWMTVGYFEVTDDTTRPVKLGGELNRGENRHIRHRMFAIVDRSVLGQHPGPQPAFDPRAANSPGSLAGQAVPYVGIID